MVLGIRKVHQEGNDTKSAVQLHPKVIQSRLNLTSFAIPSWTILEIVQLVGNSILGSSQSLGSYQSSRFFNYLDMV